MGNESRKKSILVIDDDERVLMALECFLETEGYETNTAWSGHEGMELLRSRKFDLVLVDDHLWDMDVEALLKEIRRMEVQPLVMLTESLAAPDAMQRCADLGASSWVGKWASCDEIATAVRKCFARKALEKVLI
jgi:DNA-binding response OmpR family regulator